MLRWCRIVENQPTLWTTVSELHATRSAAAATTAIRLATAHFVGAGALEHRLHRGGRVAAGRDEDAELVVREAGIVQDRAAAPSGEQSIEDDAEDRRERA